MAPILVLIEGFVILFAAGGALLISHRLPLGGWIDIVVMLAEAGGLSACILLAFYLSDLYTLRKAHSFQGFLGRLPNALVLATLLVCGLGVLVPDVRLTGNVFQSSLLLTIAVVFGPVLPLRVFGASVLRTRRFAKKLLIVGMSPLARRLIDEIERRADPRFVIAVTGAETDGSVGSRDVRCLGASVSLDRVVEDIRPDRIVVALDDRRGRLPVGRLLDARVYRGIPVEDGVQLYEHLTGKLAIEALAPSQVIFGEEFWPSGFSLAVRRGLSALVAALGLAAAAPLFAVIALAVKMDSRGPVFFAQRRIGFRGRPFTVLKFRTMHPVDHAPSEWVRDNGQRITRVGRWLRRLWLDELPQLVNVLRGDMDLVGPRPHPVSNFELFVLVARNTPEYGEAIPYYSLRCLVRPGLTGWAQVRYGYANNLDEEIEKLRYDLYYLKHRTLWLDLRIFLETLKTILSPREVPAQGTPSGDAPVPARPLPTAAFTGNGAALKRVGSAGSWEVSGLEQEASR